MTRRLFERGILNNIILLAVHRKNWLICLGIDWIQLGLFNVKVKEKPFQIYK
jgi:hypothetical protein